jgi:hypothetical protein
MDYALKEYALAYSDTLQWAHDHLGLLRENGLYRESYTGRSIGSLLPRSGRALHGSVKDSLKADVGANLASYLELISDDPRTSFPVSRDPSPQADEYALDDMAGWGGTSVEEYNKLKARVEKTYKGSVMPLYFCRADGASQTQSGGARNRNFSLLWRFDKRQLLAVLYLLPAGHELCRPLGAQQGNLVRLDTGEVFRSNSGTAIFVPLQMGHNGWQEQKFLQPALEGRIGVQCAYLIRKGEEYYLHVSFVMKCDDKYSPRAYLGVDRGILFTAAYGLVDVSGDVLEIGHFIDRLRELQIQHGKERERLAKSGRKITYRHYKRQAYDNILHCIVNKLVEIAKEYQAQLVLEDLDNIKVRGKRVVSRFKKMQEIAEYKCNLEGLPRPRSVFAAYSSLICHKCGADMLRDDRVVECTECGYIGHSDDNAAINIARRALYRKEEWVSKGGYRGFHRSFRK